MIKVTIDLKVDDRVILKPSSVKLIMSGINGKKYEKLHINNVVGTITRIEEYNNHYFWGTYASVTWDNGDITSFIHASYLEEV